MKSKNEPLERDVLKIGRSPSEAPNRLLFECRIEMPDGHLSKKNAKTIGWRFGSSSSKRPFIRSTTKAQGLERHILSVLSGIPANLRPKEPLCCPLHGVFTVSSDSFIRKDGQINMRGGDLENLIQGHCDALTKSLIIRDDSLFTRISAFKRLGPSAVDIQIYRDDLFSEN